MTDPEEHDEDLFADLYDADDAALTNDAPAPSVGPAGNDSIIEQPVEPQQISSYEAENANETGNVDENYQNGGGGAMVMDTTPTATPAAPPVQAEPEPEPAHNTGIKEDG